MKAAGNKHLIYREKNNFNIRGFLVRNPGGQKEGALHFSSVESTVNLEFYMQQKYPSGMERK